MKSSLRCILPIAVLGLMVAAAAAVEGGATTCQQTGEVKLEDYSACGVNSLYVVLRMQGADIAYGDLYREVGPDSKNYCSMADLARAVRAAGFVPVAVQPPPDAWPLFDTPCIARVADNFSAKMAGQEIGTHFVVFAGERPDGEQKGWVYIINPPHRPSLQLKLDFLNIATGQFLAVCRTDQEARDLCQRLEDHARDSVKPYGIFSAAVLSLMAVSVWALPARKQRGASNVKRAEQI